ncbi:DNA-3-methyladenine glycosylase [Bradyrhizobium sp. 5.13L]
MKLARLIKVRGLLLRSRPRRTLAWRALSPSDQTIDLAGVNLQLERGHLMPRDAGPMFSKLTADDRPVFAHRSMVRASDFGPHLFNPLCSPKAFTGGKIVRIRSLQVLPQRSTRPIGCLLEIRPSHWRIARGMFASASAGRMVGRRMRAHGQVAASWTGALAFF